MTCDWQEPKGVIKVELHLILILMIGMKLLFNL